MSESPPPTEKRMRAKASQLSGARLICTHGLCTPAAIALGDAPVVIGRGAQADIVVNAPQVSRVHASINKTTRGFTIEDIDSRNGTFVNAEPVRETPRLLQNGDEITLASVVVLRFVCEDTHQRFEQAARQGVTIDAERHDVIVDGIVVEPPLSKAQFALLALLHRRAGAIVARAEISREIWPDAAPDSISADAVDCLIKRVRARIRSIGEGNNYVDVVRGHGVRLNGRA